MKLSIHNTLGKPDKSQGFLLGSNWVNIECLWEEVFELITVDGVATSSELSNDNRCEANYVSRSLCMIDIDNGMTIQELLNNDFYNAYGAGFYVTPSHTDEHHRFRIMFRLEQSIKDASKMKKLIIGLMIVYQNADPACKDASRLYYGNPNCEIKEITNKLLPIEAVDVLIETAEILEAEEIKALQKIEAHNYTQHQYDIEYVDTLLRNIAMHEGSLKGEYDQWKSIAWATCATLSTPNAQALMMKHFPEKTKNEIKSLQAYNATMSKHTVGTLIKLSKMSKSDLCTLELAFKQRNDLLTEDELLKQFMRSK